MKWNMSTMRPSGLVKAKPRRMSMPNDDRTPEMFENRNGWSCVSTVSSQPSRFRSSQAWTDVRAEVARQPDVASRPPRGEKSCR